MRDTSACNTAAAGANNLRINCAYSTRNISMHIKTIFDLLVTGRSKDAVPELTPLVLRAFRLVQSLVLDLHRDGLTNT